ncbi:MAG: VWA domain-containing protein [Calditrichaeota bacterium]|nr:VWA domain-containing protein [Calditrichota bacterium]
MIRFAHPEYLHFLWALPVLMILALLELRWRKAAMLRWANQTMWDTAFPHRAPRNVFVKRLLGLSAIGLLILAISGPQVGTRQIEVKREGTDIVIALDVSRSMYATDISPSRLIKAKHEITRLLKRLRGDRVALVPFANVAFVQIPLTLDYSAVVTALNAMDPEIIPYPGTSLSEAIKQGQRAFRIESNAQKILILITDSEDHSTDAAEQAAEAAKEGVRIFTVGMATPQGGPIPITDARGRITGYKEYQGNTVVSRLNENILIEIAQVTGGEYFRATKTGTEFEKIFKKISGMETEEFESKQFTDYEDRFQWPAALAFILIILEMMIPAGKRRKNG